MIKILHVIKSLGRGGAEMLLPETLRLHNREKFEFHYIYFLPWKNQLVEAIEAQGGKVHCLEAKNNISLLMQYRKVIAYCQEHQIELIHCHLPWAGFLGRLVHRATGIPVLYSEHNKQERYHWLTLFLNKKTYNWQSKVLAVSADVAESIEKNISPAIPVQVLLNGVNTDRFIRDADAGAALRKELAIPEEALVVGTVAVFRFQKRLEEWLEVFARLQAGNSNWYGIIVGDGPLKAAILEKQQQLGLMEKVKMVGLQTEVRPYLSAMDVYMMSSVFEGLPIALLEAMSMECPVVSTKAGGIPELVRDGQDGLLVPVEDWQKLADKAKDLENPHQRMTLAKAARKRVLDAFSLRQMVEELERVYVEEVRHKT
jgi:glycosyltransferase involved in cell wall biosynthesis